MRISDAFPSNYLKAADLQSKDVRVTIDKVMMEEIASGEHKPVVYFRGHDKGLVLNKTNGNNIATGFGDETENWLRRRIGR